MATAEEWSKGYARQAAADFAARTTLCGDSELPECMQLHFLQMGCEKLAKAYLCGNGSTHPAKLQTSHKFVAKVIPEIVSFWLSASDQRLKSVNPRMMPKIRQWAREIELLAPAVDDNNRRPDNAEYPWEDGQGKLCIPSTYQFTNLDGLNTPDGVNLLKVLHTIAHELSES